MTHSTIITFDPWGAWGPFSQAHPVIFRTGVTLLALSQIVEGTVHPLQAFARFLTSSAHRHSYPEALNNIGLTLVFLNFLHRAFNLPHSALFKIQVSPQVTALFTSTDWYWTSAAGSITMISIVSGLHPLRFWRILTLALSIIFWSGYSIWIWLHFAWSPSWPLYGLAALNAFVGLVLCRTPRQPADTSGY